MFALYAFKIHELAERQKNELLLWSNKNAGIYRNSYANGPVHGIRLCVKKGKPY